MFLGVTGKLTRMAYTEDQRRVIAEAVRNKRITRGLDKEPAARAVDISSITWKRVEDGKGVRDASLAKVLSFLGLPNAEDLVSGRSATEGRAPEPTHPRLAGAVHYGTLLWDAVVDAADSVRGTPCEQKAEHAVIVAADVLPELVLMLNPGPSARPLLEQTIRRGAEALDRIEQLAMNGARHDVETAPESYASPQVLEDEEALVDDAEETRRLNALVDRQLAPEALSEGMVVSIEDADNRHQHGG